MSRSSSVPARGQPGSRSSAVLPPLARSRLVSLTAPEITRLVALALAVGAQIALLLIALIPQTEGAARALPDGPIPRSLFPAVAGLFYVLPALTGALCQRWQVAVLLATLPAWLDLGAFAVAAAQRIGPFYLAQEPHASSAAGTIELFAFLGALGWLGRGVVLAAVQQVRGARS